eukprot:scaffold1954_cov268-Pinguiococcus_pyrenoidosus.AAC.148
MRLVGALDVQGFVGMLRVCQINLEPCLHLGNAFASQARLIDHCRAGQDEGIARNKIRLAVVVFVLGIGVGVGVAGLVRVTPIRPAPAFAVHEDGLAPGAHVSQRLQALQSREHHRRLEHENHEDAERAVLPVLIQEPEAVAEHLEDHDRREQLLDIELPKGGHVKHTAIRAVLLSRSSHLCFRRQACRVGVVDERIVCLAPNLHEGTTSRVPGVVPSRVDEPRPQGRARLPLQGHKGRLAATCRPCWRDVNVRRCGHGIYLPESNEALEPHGPHLQQHQQDVQRDREAQPKQGPEAGQVPRGQADRSLLLLLLLLLQGLLVEAREDPPAAGILVALQPVG